MVAINREEALSISDADLCHFLTALGQRLRNAAHVEHPRGFGWNTAREAFCARLSMRTCSIAACRRTMPAPAVATCAGDQNICVVGTMVVSEHPAVLVPGRPFPVIRLPLPGPQKDRRLEKCNSSTLVDI